MLPGNTQPTRRLRHCSHQHKVTMKMHAQSQITRQNTQLFLSYLDRIYCLHNLDNFNSKDITILTDYVVK
jgi:hypothetical protein